MKNDVAYIIERMSLITDERPMKRMVQKIAFLLQRKGIDLGLQYTLPPYGPYSEDLEYVLVKLYTDGIVDFQSTKLCIREPYTRTNLSSQQQQIVEDVINRYKDKTASDLELLTTAIYAYDHIAGDVICDVKRIKGEKYSDAEIDWALNEFSYFGIAV